jgi:hypothetical protein
MKEPEDNVVLFPGKTRLAIPVDRVLREALDLNLTSEIVVGVDPDGDLSYWYSNAEPNEAFFMLHKAAQDILDDD